MSLCSLVCRSGKTTAAAKLAYLLKQKNTNPLLVACDVYRPAAADQLQTLGEEIGVRVFRGDGQDPVKIAKEGVRDAIDSLRDVVLSILPVVCMLMKRCG